jgi:MinD superfamily P-loop ATPase
MKVAVASGKGGTGKTTVATNLAWVAATCGRSVSYVDCDVEEPNGHLFLAPEWRADQVVTRPVPQVDEARCTHCGKCGEICQFSAIAPLDVTVLVFPELCHGCGGCRLVCPAGAIREVPREIGMLRIGHAEQIRFTSGLLNVGEAMSPPLIRQVKAAAPQADLTLIDAPPGTSCPVIEAVRGVDFVLLVTEPTPFGLNDLRLAVDMTRALGLPMGVVINRADSGDRETRRYARAEGLPVLAEIPDDRRVAEAYSRGELAGKILPSYRRVFQRLLARLEKESGQGRKRPSATRSSLP